MPLVELQTPELQISLFKQRLGCNTGVCVWREGGTEVTEFNSWSVVSVLSIIFMNYLGAEPAVSALPGHSRTNCGVSVTGGMGLS